MSIENDPLSMERHLLTVSVDAKPDRIDKYISDVLQLSRNHVQKLIADGFVTVNARPVKSKYAVRPDDSILVEIPKAAETELIAEDIPLDILYEDKDLLIINKPKGMVVHPAPGHESGTLVNAIMYHCKDDLSGINGELRPGIVHRIDRNTTGSLIVCKNDMAHQWIADQLKVHSITRNYVGIVHGRFKEENGTVDASIGRDPKDRKRMCVTEKNSRNAVTHYQVLHRYKDFTYMRFSLETGRTHQIRVHMKHIRHPILGDDVYGPSKCPYKLEGQTLHAETIGFIHPTTKKYLEVSAPLPAYFTHLLEILPE